MNRRRIAPDHFCVRPVCRPARSPPRMHCRRTDGARLRWASCRQSWLPSSRHTLLALSMVTLRPKSLGPSVTAPSPQARRRSIASSAFRRCRYIKVGATVASGHTMSVSFGSEKASSASRRSPVLEGMPATPGIRFQIPTRRPSASRRPGVDRAGTWSGRPVDVAPSLVGEDGVHIAVRAIAVVSSLLYQVRCTRLSLVTTGAFERRVALDACAGRYCARYRRQGRRGGSAVGDAV